MAAVVQELNICFKLNILFQPLKRYKASNVILHVFGILLLKNSAAEKQTHCISKLCFFDNYTVI